jgi:hypothetical protein
MDQIEEIKLRSAGAKARDILREVLQEMDLKRMTVHEYDAHGVASEDRWNKAANFGRPKGTRKLHAASEKVEPGRSRLSWVCQLARCAALTAASSRTCPSGYGTSYRKWPRRKTRR